MKEKIYTTGKNSKNIVIITKKELDRMQIRSFSDLFSGYTAVCTSKRGAGDTSFDLIMRGSNFEQVLVLIDGIPFNNPQTGHFNTDFPFSIDDIERVEIVRGGSTTTYGAGAFAGVINIILKTKIPLRLDATAGEHRYFSSRISASKTFKNLGFQLSFNTNSSPGYYQGREFNHTNVSSKIFYLKDKIETNLFSGFLIKKFGAEGFYAPYPSQEKVAAFFSLLRMHKKGKHFDYSLAFSYNHHDDKFVLDRNQPDFFNSHSQTTTVTSNLSVTNRLKHLRSTAGIDLKIENMKSSTMGYQKRFRPALYLNMNLGLRKGGIDTGIRSDFISNHSPAITYYTGIYYNIRPNLQLKTGYGRALRLPTFTELYYQSPANKGNPALEVETSTNLETSISLFSNRSHLDLSVFYRWQKNLIDWIRLPSSDDTWQATNIAKNNITGIELTYRFRLKRTLIVSGVEKIFAVNEKPHEFISKYGLRFPDFRFIINVSQRIARPFTISTHYCYKEIYGTPERGHFLDLILTLRFGAVEFSIRGDNLLNTIIEELPGVRIPGRWIYLTVSFKKE